MKFKGFDDWIEIFRGGKQTDSKGKEHDGDKVIDQILSTFDPSFHEPPLVVGHPEENAPAFGWVEKLKTITTNGMKTLLMKAKDVVPEFEEMVKKGRWKKRSISVYPDGRLRHVGFLGAMPPAVKGLQNMAFNDDEGAVVFEFSDAAASTIARLFRRLRDWLIEKEGQEIANDIIPDWDVEYIGDIGKEPSQTTGWLESTEIGAEPAFSAGSEIKTKKEGKAMTFKEFLEVFKFWNQVKDEPGLVMPGASQGTNIKPPDSPPVFSEADLEAARKEAEEKGRKETEAKFAEDAKKQRTEARKKEIADFCDKGMKEGRLIPAWIKMGLKEFMERLNAEETVVFSEGADKVSSYDWFKGFLEEIPKVVEFKEIATRGEDVSAGDAAGKLDALIRKKMTDNKELTYNAAFSEVQQENPDLVLEYQAERGGVH